MSDIAPISRPSAAAMPASRKSPPVSGTPAAATQPADKVELSTAAQLLGKIARLPDIRQELVDHVRTQIELDSYETPEKVDAAIDAVAEDLA